MLEIEVLLGDITKQEEKATFVVNSANSHMISGAGVSGMIYEAAGEKLEEYVARHGRDLEFPGDAFVTPGFELESDIIHVLAPDKSAGQNDVKDLENAYDTALKVAIENNAESIDFPLLGAGIFKWDNDESVRAFMRVLEAADRVYPKHNLSVPKIRLILFTMPSIKTVEKEFNENEKWNISKENNFHFFATLSDEK